LLQRAVFSIVAATFFAAQLHPEDLVAGPVEPMCFDAVAAIGLRYTDPMPKVPDISIRSEAESYAAAWRRAGPELDAKRLQKLRSLSEEDSARCFAELLAPIGELPLRSSSGLVEQQRLFARMREECR